MPGWDSHGFRRHERALLMSSDIAIAIENIGKCYHIYNKPRDRLLQMICRGRRNFFKEFWALRDVSINIQKGETLGIIGRNGSGKSTLLQLICGTLNPTSGKIHAYGKIAALLELGAGFNPEFSGRENVYMSSFLYGLSKEEVDKRFDDIAAFADIGDFIEQPVKIYSSGMYVRLAFAVITHVDADILVIDEALAVGDAVFTQKCMRFIRTFKEKGTLIFVSHDMPSISNLCRNTIWLERGQMKMFGKAKKVSEAYLQDTLQGVYGNDANLQTVGDYEKNEDESESTEEIVDDPGPSIDYGSQYSISDNLNSARGFQTGAAKLTSIEIANLTNPNEPILKGAELVKVTVNAQAIHPLDKPILGFVFNDRLGQELFGENTLAFTDISPMQVAAGESFYAEFTFHLPMLPNGEYVVFASVANGELHNNIQHHLLHDTLIVKVSSSKVRYGLVGVPFEHVEMKVCQ